MGDARRPAAASDFRRQTFVGQDFARAEDPSRERDALAVWGYTERHSKELRGGAKTRDGVYTVVDPTFCQFR